MMKKATALLFVAYLGACAYGLYHNPVGCKRLALDIIKDAPELGHDISAIFAQPPAPGTPGVTPSNPAYIRSAPSAAAVTASQVPIPSKPNWTWTTPAATYHNVKVVKIEPDCVTILHDDGGASVPIADLPPDIQQLLHYNPDAATQASAQRTADAAAASQADAAMNEARAELRGSVTDFSTGLSLARSSNRRVLMHFTGSDWCPYCKTLDEEVFSKNDFARFVSTHYVVVTLDFPRETPLPANLQQQNDSLKSKFAVSVFPTLVVLENSGQERGRIEGYQPGIGPAPVIQDLSR